MATKPATKKSTFSAANAQKAVNAIYHNATETYQAKVPSIGTKAGKITDTSTQTLRRIGNALLDYAPLRNEFVSALYNRIGKVIITSKAYENPWAFFKRGLLEYGETIEEVFVGLSKSHDFDPEIAETNVFQREDPEVYSAFHSVNYQHFYKVTIQKEVLRQAFLSWEGVVDLVAKMTESMYNSANYDEYQVMKFLISSSILNGYITPVQIGTTTGNEMTDISIKTRAVGSSFTFMSNKYNEAGVPTYTNFAEQYLIMDSDFAAAYDVEVLANAFNMDKAQFLARRVLVDGFGNMDWERLDMLFGTGKNPSYRHFTDDEIKTLDSVPAVLVDKDWFMIYDNLEDFNEIQNPEGLYWNQFYHVWKIFSTSPFANAVVFTKEEGEVISVTVPSNTMEIAKGQTITVTANVETTGFVSKKVRLENVEEDQYIEPTINGMDVTAPNDANIGNMFKIKVVSEADPTKSAEILFTVG